MERKLTLHLSDGNEVEILSFEYSAKRMSGAPTISATIKHFDELDINTSCYTEFNGEKYYVKQTPTKTRENTDARYKYEISFVSERDILDNIYFYDASKSSSSANARIAHNTTFHWSGTIYDYVDKLNESLDFSFKGVENHYHVSVDAIGESYEAEYKFISLENQYFTSALQEIYNTYGLPYYFDGKTIYVGYQGSSLNEDHALDYGCDKGLLSITKSNANYKVVNKCTATGSSENLPYYYPNKSANGEHDVEFRVEDFGNVEINFDTLSKQIKLVDGEVLTYNSVVYSDDQAKTLTYRKYKNGTTQYSTTKEGVTSFLDTIGITSNSTQVSIRFNVSDSKEYKIALNYAITLLGSELNNSIKSYGIGSVKVRLFSSSIFVNLDSSYIDYSDSHIKFTTHSNTNNFEVEYAMVIIDFNILVENMNKDCIPANMSFSYQFNSTKMSSSYFYCDKNKKEIPAEGSGIETLYALNKAKIKIGPSKNLMPYQQTLMPSIYRATLGAERFYKASNTPYTVEVEDDDKEVLTHNVEYLDKDGNRFVFDNPYDASTMNYREHTFTVDDLKPSIKETEYRGKRIDVIEDVAFDENDNNELNENDEYKHSYFYVKLRPLGFNLFSHASESGDMTISFTSGDCTACNFTIGVNDLKKNTIQVDGEGNLQFDSEGNVLTGNPQDRQNDTTENYVWVALKKEEQTYNTIMPDKSKNIVPKAGDVFVILNINLPFSYIEAAEKKLEDKIKEYLMENNSEKFNFSIKFSRIFLAENEDFSNNLNENSRILIKDSNYGSVWLYVSSFNYKINSSEPLPEITVSLSDTLSTPQAPLQNVINKVKEDVQTSINSLDIVTMGARSFIRKDTDDETTHSIKVNHLNIVEDTNAEGDLKVGGDLSVDRRAKFSDNVEVHGDITSSNYEEILGEIKGAKIDQQGNGVFKSLRANSMEVFTMIYNQMKVSSAYTSFDDAGTIVEIEDLGDKKFKLTFDQAEFPTKDSNGVGIQPFVEEDILHGIVNNINDYAYSQSGECWLFVVETPTSEGSLLEQNQVIAQMYEDEDVDVETNLEPTTNMVLVHKGNKTNKVRQSTFYISSKEGNFIQLLDVNSPKLLRIQDGYSNYGVVVGKLPKDLFDYVKDRYDFVNEQDPMLYAKYAVIENLLQLDYLGRPIQTDNYRGEWSFDEAQNNPYKNLPTYFDSVTYEGELWKCNVSDTLQNPKEGDDWSLLVSKGSDGQGISIKGSYDTLTAFESEWKDANGSWIAPTNPSDGYVVAKDLYIWNGSSWENVGAFRGEDGKSVAENLLDNTGFDSVDANGVPLAWSKSDETTVKIVDKSESGLGQNVVSISHGVGEYKMITQQLISGRLQASTWYTLSFYIKRVTGSNSSAILSLSNYNQSAKYYFDGTSYSSGFDDMSFSMSTSWVKHTVTFQTDSVNTNVLIGFGATVGRTNREIHIGKVKLELASDQEEPKNSTPTSWVKNTDDYTSESIYLAGNWESTKTYRKENNCVPVVKHNGFYYILKSVESINSVPSDLAHWRPFQHFQYLFSDFLMANEARFGSEDGGVFYENKLVSAKDANGKSFGEEGWGSEDAMLSLDFKEGKLKAMDAEIKGHIEATSGTIDNITATNITVDSGSFSGLVSARKFSTPYFDARFENDVSIDDVGYNIVVGNTDEEYIKVLSQSASYGDVLRVFHIPPLTRVTSYGLLDFGDAILIDDSHIFLDKKTKIRLMYGIFEFTYVEYGTFKGWYVKGGDYLLE